MNRLLQLGLLVGLAAVAFAGGLVVFTGGDEPTASGPNAGAVTASPSEPSTSDRALLAAQAADLGCAARSLVDKSYAVQIASEPDPPRVEGTTFRLSVAKDGEPVTGALVCFSAGMSEMSHDGVLEETEEVAAGVYEVHVSFAMRGPWAGSVKIIEPGVPAVRVPFSTSVE